MRGSSSPAARRSTSAFRRSPAREPTASARSECLRHSRRDPRFGSPAPRALRLRGARSARSWRAAASLRSPSTTTSSCKPPRPPPGSAPAGGSGTPVTSSSCRTSTSRMIGRRNPRDRASRRTRHAPSVPLQWRLDPAAHEPAGCQEVWHYHLHVFPRHVDDDLYGSRWRDTAPDERLPYAELVRNALTRAPT